MRPLMIFGMGFCGGLVALSVLACPLRSKPTPVSLLLDMTYEGGMRLCTQSDCLPRLQLKTDGTYEATSGTGTRSAGKISQRDLTQFKQAIAQTNFTDVRSHPFTDTCPIAYDGTKTIYRFYVSAQIQQIDSCVVKVDPKHPLFRQADRLMEDAMLNLSQPQPPKRSNVPSPRPFATVQPLV
ncbi:MAG TPA: hypothetical protein V6D19_22430 [Stenomitos sp.]